MHYYNAATLHFILMRNQFQLTNVIPERFIFISGGITGKIYKNINIHLFPSEYENNVHFSDAGCVKNGPSNLSEDSGLGAQLNPPLRKTSNRASSLHLDMSRASSFAGSMNTLPTTPKDSFLFYRELESSEK